MHLLINFMTVIIDKVKTSVSRRNHLRVQQKSNISNERHKKKRRKKVDKAIEGVDMQRGDG